MQKLRVLHLDSRSDFGGGQRQLQLLMEGLKQEGVEQALAARAGSTIESIAQEFEVPVFHLKQRNDLDICSALRLKSIVSEFQPSCIHTHTNGSLTMTMWARKYFGLKGPAVIFNTRRLTYPIDNWMGKQKYRYGADYHVGISQICEDQMVGAGVDPQRISVVYSGVIVPNEVNRAEGRKQLLELTSFQEEHCIVGAAGNLFAHKRFDWIVRAVAEAQKAHPHVRLVVFGDGECREQLERLRVELKQESNIALVGHIDKPERYFSGLDIFALASRLEGLGTILMDAMLRKVSLLGANTIGINEVITHQQNGLLFDMDRFDDLVEKLSLLITDPSLRGQLGAQGVIVGQEKFDIRHTVRQMLQLYRSKTEALT